MRLRELFQRVHGPAWAALLVLLAAGLGAQAWRAGREGAQIGCRGAGLWRRLEELRDRNRALREEIRALRSDPVYVESLLRRWRMACPNERIVD